jgi:hypothetical protein
MAQRITTVVAVILALAAVVACGVLWSSVRQTRELLADALAQTRAQTEKSAETNAALVARIEELSKSSEQMSSFAMEWNPIRIKLVKGENGTDPAEGYRARLTGGVYESDGIFKMAGANGLIDFGHVQPGRYTIKISTPWGATRSFEFEITPGTTIDRTIACPAEPVVDADVRLEVDWPGNLPEEIDSVVVTVSRPVQPFEENSWALSRNATGHSYVIRRDGTVALMTDSSVYNYNTMFGFTQPDRQVPSYLKPFVAADIRLRNWREEQRPGPINVGHPRPPEWQTARYSLSQIVLVWSDIWQASAAASGSGRRPGFGGFNPVGVVSVATNEQPRGEGDFPSQQQSFTPGADEPNVWRISIPEEMVAQARERVERFKSSIEERAPADEAPVRSAE